MPIGTRPVGYANTNLSGRHFNGEATAYGQCVRRRGRSEVDLFGEDTKSGSLKIGRQSVSQSVSQTASQGGQLGPGRKREEKRERMENAWQASTGSISRGKDKFLIGPRYTDDSLLVDLITPRYGGLYKPPSTARILITFCLKPAKFLLRERERDRRADSPVEDT